MTPFVSGDRTIKIASFYPELMDLYGDLGNVLTIKRRCEWRGINVEIVEVRHRQPAEIADADLLLMGGGEDSAQSVVAADLQDRAQLVRELIDGGAAALVVCGGFQLFGASYTTSSGETLPGIGVFNARTTAGSDRLIGNIVVEARLRRYGAAYAQPPVELVGFENHAGRTTLGEGCAPLGRVLCGGGNDGVSGTEGAVYRNAIGTYLHGPLLPKNPHLADHLIVAALAHRYGVVGPLAPLEDGAERRAHHVAAERCLCASTGPGPAQATPPARR